MSDITIDLHVHTTASDGYHSPEVVVGLAVRAGVTLFSVTDHDTIGGVAEAARAAAAAGLEFVPGVEFTTGIDEDEIHILAYFALPAPPELLALVSRAQAGRARRIAEVVDNLARVGIALPDGDRGGDGVTSRSHLARALVASGQVSSFQEAFDRYLAHGTRFVPPPELQAEEASAVAWGCGCLASWAHPAQSRLDRYLPRLRASGLKGLEAYTARRSGSQGRRVAGLARDAGLVPTAGTDWHGQPGGRDFPGLPVPEKAERAVREALGLTARV